MSNFRSHRKKRRRTQDEEFRNWRPPEAQKPPDPSLVSNLLRRDNVKYGKLWWLLFLVLVLASAAAAAGEVAKNEDQGLTTSKSSSTIQTSIYSSTPASPDDVETTEASAKEEDQIESAVEDQEVHDSDVDQEPRQPKLFRVQGEDSPSGIIKDFHKGFGRRISKPQRLAQPRPASIITQTRPFTNVRDPPKVFSATKLLPKRPVVRIKQKEQDISRQKTGSSAASVISERFVKLNTPVTKEKEDTLQDQLASGSEEHRAFIRLVLTVAPKPFTASSQAQPAKDSKRRTVVRRLPIRPTKARNEPEDSAKDEEVSDQDDVAEKMKSRMRIKDSLLARVQGRFRVRSTTQAPFQGSSSSTEGNSNNNGRTEAAEAVKNDVRMIRRNRIRNREISTTTALTTSVTSTTTEISRATSPSTITSLPTVTTSTRVPPTLKTTAGPTSNSSYRPRSTIKSRTSPTATTSSTTTTSTTITSSSITLSTTTTSLTTTKTSAEITTADRLGPKAQSEAEAESRGSLVVASEEPPDKSIKEEEGESNEKQGTPPKILERHSSRMDGLRKELLAAIRRKISKSKTAATTTSTTVKPKPIIGFRSGGGVKIKHDPQRNELQGDVVSPSSNALVPTDRPSFYRPFSLPRIPPQTPVQESPESGDVTKLQPPVREQKPRVQFFVRVPGRKPGSNVKIPHIAHIQGKLARLNAAISEGLKESQQQRRDEAVDISPRPIVVFTPSTSPAPVTSTDSNVRSHSSVVFSVGKSAPAPGQSSSTTTRRVPTFDSTSRSNYLEVLRQRMSVNSTMEAPEVSTKTTTQMMMTSSSTTTTTTTSTATTTTKRTTTATPATTTTTRPRIHRASHFRPGSGTKRLLSEYAKEEEEKRFQRSSSTRRSVTPPSNLTDASNLPEGVIHDISGTTIYVVAVIAIIPMAGIVAWLVRFVVKKKDLSRAESGSETGLHLGPGEDDHPVTPGLTPGGRVSLHQPGGRQHLMQQENSRDLDIESCDGNLSQLDHSEISGLLSSSSWQFNRSNLRLKTVLGEGNFGKVWKAEADSLCDYEGRTILVAVKAAKEDAPQREVGDLLQEMRIMQQIGPHPNVVAMLGVCVEKEPYLLIMEYVMYGKLLAHLREQRSRQNGFFGGGGSDAELQVTTGGPGDDDSMTSPGHELTAKDLTKYAYGVAKGMEYIVSKGIIHRDLAARNILIDHNRVCKISDFGLSRNLSDTGSEMYEQKTKGALPIRWMAPESLYFSVFTAKSDVWSFGILMWEIVTLGSTPYPGMGAREVMRRVRDGYRLERPSHCHPELYKIISKCWSGDMNKRPDFPELRQELAKLLEAQHGYIDLQNIPENKYYSMTQNSNEEEKL